MVFISSIGSKNTNALRKARFRGESSPAAEAEQEQKEPAKLLYEEKKKHPISLGLKIQGNKLKNAFTAYPVKGFQGSKNSNFYEFLTMGTVPYLIGSGMMIALFNYANKFYDTPARSSASKIGRKAALGVLFYGIAKTLSKKLIETPLNMKYGIDLNVPYRMKIDELPEARNRDNLVSYEYHKAYESVDFPYWDLFSTNKAFGEERDSYFKNIGRKMGFTDDELINSAQKVKPRIREKLVQAKAFSSLSSYLWAAIGVGIASQKPFEGLLLNPVQRYRDWKNGIKNTAFASDFAGRFKEACKDFIGWDRAGVKDFIVQKFKKDPIPGLKKPETAHIAGRLLFAAAAGVTLLGNFFTLTDFKNKDKNAAAAAPLIDDSKDKAVC